MQNKEKLLKNGSLLTDSLRKLTEFLYQYHGQEPVVLIDEYDVPLATAAQYGFYDEAVDIMSCMLGSALKDNSYLAKGILTGCLPFVREVITTGINHADLNSVVFPNPLAAAVGFTAAETSELLNYYGYGSVREDIMRRYGGYRFDGEEICCPWDILNYADCNLALPDKSCFNPGDFWADTGSADVIKEFLGFIGGSDTRLMDLADGKEAEIEVKETLSYRDLEQHFPEDCWTVLLYTGYLTVTKRVNPHEFNPRFLVKIPNEAIRACFKRILNSPKI